MVVLLFAGKNIFLWRTIWRYGGHGSDIIFKVDEGLHTLLDLRYQKEIKGKKGENGKGKNQHGKGAEPLVVKVPQGTVVTDLDTGLILADLKGKMMKQ